VALFKRNRSVPSLSEVVNLSAAATANNSVNQTGVVTVCFLRLQCAAGYFNRYVQIEGYLDE